MTDRAAQSVRVPQVADLQHGEARPFTFDDGEHEGRGFVMMLRDDQGQDGAHSEGDRGAAQLVAYRNRCAHVAFDLDMGTGQFWSSTLGRIYCRTHGACYEPRSGVCDRGPCVGRSLEAFVVERQGDDAIVRIPAEPPGAA